ncbi:hypothetical protein Efla_000765 [Eimeria flavescens]
MLSADSAAAAAAAGGRESLPSSSSSCGNQSHDEPTAAAAAAEAEAAAAEAAAAEACVLPPELAERYVVERELGRGVYGSVFVCRMREEAPLAAAAWDSSSLSPSPTSNPAATAAAAAAAADAAAVRVAVKKVALPSWRLKGVFGLDQQALRELCALRCLSHANVLALKAFHFAMEPWQQGQQQQQRQEGEKKRRRKRLRPTFYLVTELCDYDLGEALSKQQRRHSRFIKKWQQQQQQQQTLQQTRQQEETAHAPLPGFSEQDAKLIVYQLLQALAHCHSRGLLHRDVKPQNIFLSRETEGLSGETRWVVRLGDFGLCCPFLGEAADKTAGVVTLLYRPPELLLGSNKYGPEVDVWAAAAVAAELVLGRPLFRCSSELLLLSRMQQLLGPEAGETLKALARRQQAETPQLERSVPFASVFRDFFGRRLLSEEGISFLKSLLELDPARRPSCLSALTHPWLRSAVAAFPNLQVYVHPTPAPTLPTHYHPLDPINQRHLFSPTLQQQQQQQQQEGGGALSLVAPWEEAPTPQQLFGLPYEATASARFAASQWRLSPRFVAEALSLP